MILQILFLLFLFIIYNFLLLTFVYMLISPANPKFLEIMNQVLLVFDYPASNTLKMSSIDHCQLPFQAINSKTEAFRKIYSNLKSNSTSVEFNNKTWGWYFAYFYFIFLVIFIIYYESSGLQPMKTF